MRSQFIMLCMVIASTTAVAEDLEGWQNPFRPSPPLPQLVSPGSPPGTKPVVPTLFDDLSNAGLSLQNSITNKAQGASFGESNTGGHSGFSSQFALTYRSQSFYGSPYYDVNDPYLVAAVDGNINTATATARLNSVFDGRFQIGKDFLSQETEADPFHPSLPPVPVADSVLNTRSGLLYETTEDSKMRNIFFETSWSFLNFGVKAGPVQLRQYTPFGDSNFYYLIDPFFTTQVGENLHGLTFSREFNSTRFRLIQEPIISILYVAPGQPAYFGISSLGPGQSRVRL
jgi:hypothetical protein